MKKKGFTLVELLAVIVVLAIIAVIAIPTLINVIEKTKVNALKDSSYGVIEAGRLYVAQNQPDQDILFTITNNNITSEQTDKVLKYKGNIKNGIVIVSTSSKVAICIDNGKNYAVKLLDEEEVKTGTGTCESYEAANGEFVVNSPVAELRKEYERQLQEQKESYENRISDLENNLLEEQKGYNKIVRLETSGPGGSSPAWMYRSYPNDYKVLIIYRWHGSGTPRCTYNGVEVANQGISYEGIFVIFNYKANTQIATYGDWNSRSYRADYLTKE